MVERRTRVQGNGAWRLSADHTGRLADDRPPGTVEWQEHERAWEGYARRYGKRQSAERMAQRGGFGYCELTEHLGHEPKTWRIAECFKGTWVPMAEPTPGLRGGASKP